MREHRYSRLGPDSDLVVVYVGTDAHYHRPRPDQPNRPVCTPSSPAGVLTKTKSAEDSGLVPCSDCRCDRE